MKANYEEKIPKATSDVTLGNLYDMNKQIMEHEPEMTKEAMRNVREQLKNWLSDRFRQKYFMLLCNDLKDYTVFNLDKSDQWFKPTNAVWHAAGDVIECLTNRGTLLSMEEQEDGAWECWIKTGEGCFAYYFFPYGQAVLEY
jgi:hypothetical protein